MRPVPVHELTRDVLDQFYDPRSIERGRVYAVQGRVQVLVSEPGEAVGVVQGNSRQPYLVDVGWASDGRGYEVHDSCSCPVAYGCKHAAALIITLQSHTSDESRPAANWRKALNDLRPENDATITDSPLALEVAVITPKPTRFAPDPQPDVTLRPLRMGAKGLWIRSGVGWRDIGSPYDQVLRGVDSEHRDALRALLATTGATMYSLPAVVVMSSARPGVWDMLRRCLDQGVVLTAERGGPSTVVLAGQPASVVVDLVAKDNGAVELSARLDHDELDLGSDALVWGLLGNPVHGLFAIEGSTLRLVPLQRRLRRSVAQLLTGPPVAVPAHDRDELLDEYVPLIAGHARIGSSDNSVPVVLSEFEGLVAIVRRPAVDIAELSWGAQYRRGEHRTTYLLGEPVRTGRDRQREVSATDELDLPTHLLDGLTDDEGRPTVVFASGQDAVSLLVEVVPWLAERGQVLLDVDDELPDLRQATGDPLISLHVADAETTDGAVGNDWFDLSVDVSVDGERIGFAQLFAALSRADEIIVLPSGTWLRLDRPEFDRLRELIGEAAGLADGLSENSVRINRFQTSWWDDLTALGVVEQQSERWARSVAQLSSLSAPVSIAPPAGLRATLRHYQQEGLDWLAFLVENQLGGVLADDMGLGKTVQTLAVMLHVLERSPAARFLVVAPTSVVENWHREAELFAPGMQVCTIGETAKRRGVDLATAVGDARLVVTSYALFRLEFDEYQAFEWDLLVLDEAQFVKNHQAKSYQCARRLKASTKLAVTGTPLENSLMDLWSLLSITAPGLYPDPKRFSEVYRKPIESGNAPERLTTLRKRIAPLMRRRTKDEVLDDLPPKTELIVEVPMNARHARIYQTQLQRQRQKVLGLVGDMQRNRFEIFKSLTLLRQLSLDPGLVDPSHHNVGSAKLDRLIDDLQQVVAEGHKALVFSQFTRYLALVKKRLDEAGIDYAYLDGRTRKRQEAISRFKEGQAPVFVISLKAGGFGLNLTEADYCFVLDPWWNPAVETQAVDRTHRIGQQNPVMVYRYVSTGTIEEKVMELKERKAALFNSVIDADGALSGALGADDIRGLFE